MAENDASDRTVNVEEQVRRRSAVDTKTAMRRSRALVVNTKRLVSEMVLGVAAAILRLISGVTEVPDCRLSNSGSSAVLDRDRQWSTPSRKRV